MDRRGFLKALGIGTVAAVPVVKALAAEPVDGFDVDMDSVRAAGPIFQDGDMIYDGVIVRDVGHTHTLTGFSEFTSEVYRQFMRENLFRPYMT